MVRVFIADDHAVVRDGLRAVISGQPDMEVVGEAGDGAAIVACVVESGADLVVMDVTMPNVGGAEATQELLRALAHVKVVALSAHEDRGYIEQMLAAGALGYVVKRSAGDELIRAIRCVASGGSYVDPSIGGSLVSATPRAAETDESGAAKLSEREAEVLRLIARGYPLKEIAEVLDISVRTIETYRARGMEKLGLRTRADVVRFAAEHGWFTKT